MVSEANGCWLLAAGCWLLLSSCMSSVLANQAKQLEKRLVEVIADSEEEAMQET